MSNKNKRHIARIKINNKTIFSLICSRERDYILAPPKFEVFDSEKGGYGNSHFTLHTLNNRVTHKVTDFGNNEKCFDDFLREAYFKDFYVSRNRENGNFKDIDLQKGERYLELDSRIFIGNICTFVMKDDMAFKFFVDIKGDDKFNNLINITLPDDFKNKKIEMKVCKNPVFSIFDIYRKIKHEQIYILEEKLENDIYKFIIVIDADNSGKLYNKKIVEV